MPPLPPPRQSRATAAGHGSYLTSGTLASRLLGGVLVVLLVSLGLAVAPAPAHATGAGCDDAILATAEVRIGVSCLGNLGTTPTPGVDPDGVGLQYVDTGAEAVTQGAVFEGWGVADGATGVSGNVDPGHADENGGQSSSNLDLVNFATDGTTAVSVVNVGTTFQVKQDVHPIAGNPNLFEATVSIQNTSPATTDLRYRRVMDWDIPPTPFQELVTLQQGESQYLQFTSDDGFASADPQSARTAKLASGSFVRSGPKDHGALFDFDFGALASGATRTFEIYYGAAANESTAMAALGSVQAEAYSLGEADGSQLDPAQDPASLNTFIFGFKDISGSSDAVLAPFAVKDKSNVDNDAQATINVLANDSDPRGQQIHIVSSTAATHGTAGCNTGTGVCTYTSDPGYEGSDTFSYTIANTSGLTSSASVVMTVEPAPLNHAPAAGDDTFSLDEDTVKSYNVLANDFDEDGSNILTATVTTNPTHGTVTCSADGSCTYTPTANFNGTDVFSYTLTDGHGGSDRADVTITVNPVNDAPVAVADAFSLDEDTTRTLAVTGNDTDVDSTGLTASVVTDPGHGTVTCTGGSCVYLPVKDYNGADSFTYKAYDGALYSNVVSVALTVIPVNDAPVATDQSFTLVEDGQAEVGLLDGASDADTGDVVSLDSHTNPAHGTLVCSGSACTYSPAADYNGPDSFTYTVVDGHGGSDTKTVSFTITAVNDAPVAQAITATTAEDTAKAITLSASDVDHDVLTYAKATGPGHGTVTCATDGSCTYTPAVDYNGPDSFTYTVSDGHGGLDTKTVSLTVTAVNDAPVAQAITATTAEDTAKAITLSASDVDHDVLTYAKATGPGHGTVTCATDGSCTYTPAVDYNGPDSFTYTVSDGHGGLDTKTVSLTVTAVNDAPVAQAITATTAEDTAKAITLSASDVDGDTLTYAKATNPSHGAIACTGGSCTYTPAADYNGPDSFTYTASDGLLVSDPATVLITVAAVDDAPVAAPDNARTTAGTQVVVPVLDNDTDVDSSTLTVTGHTDPAHGQVSCTSTTCTYTPGADFVDRDTFTYTVSDGSLTATGEATIRVPNRAPEPATAPLTTLEDTALPLTLAADASDPDHDPLTVASYGVPQHGTIVRTSAGDSYVPVADYHGADSFTYVLDDGEGATSAATANVTVTSVNDLPVVATDTLVVDAGSTSTVSVLDNDTDVDGDTLSVTASSQATRGSVACTESGTCTYSAGVRQRGADSFTYTVSDGHGGVVVGTVQVTVVQLLAVPDAPRLATTKLGTAAVTKALTTALTKTYAKKPGTKAAKAKALAKAKAKLAAKKYNLLAGWVAPAYDGGSKITGYKVVLLSYAVPKTKAGAKPTPKSKTPKLVSKKTLSAKGQDLTLAMKLKPGTYKIQVLAVNAQGSSELSGMSKTLVIKK